VGRDVIRGALAGAAGTTALNAVTYLDMVLRGRPVSRTPEETIRRIEELTHRPLSADGPGSEKAANRRSGLGALLGIAAGLGGGAVYGLVRSRLARNVPLPLMAVGVGVGVNAGTVVPMAALGVADPRTWSVTDWISDVVPHLAYGFVTAWVFDLLSPPPRRTLFGLPTRT
jgi:hypothetical protein